jgi:hypothetical protein
MNSEGPIAQPGSELPAHNRLVPGSNPGGPTPINNMERRAPLAGSAEVPKGSAVAAQLPGLFQTQWRINCVKR